MLQDGKMIPQCEVQLLYLVFAREKGADLGRWMRIPGTGVHNSGRLKIPMP